PAALPLRSTGTEWRQWGHASRSQVCSQVLRHRIGQGVRRVPHRRHRTATSTRGELCAACTRVSYDVSTAVVRVYCVLATKPSRYYMLMELADDNLHCVINAYGSKNRHLPTQHVLAVYE